MLFIADCELFSKDDSKNNDKQCDDGIRDEMTIECEIHGLGFDDLLEDIILSVNFLADEDTSDNSDEVKTAPQIPNEIKMERAYSYSFQNGSMSSVLPTLENSEATEENQTGFKDTDANKMKVCMSTPRKEKVGDVSECFEISTDIANISEISVNENAENKDLLTRGFEVTDPLSTATEELSVTPVTESDSRGSREEGDGNLSESKGKGFRSSESFVPTVKELQKLKKSTSVKSAEARSLSPVQPPVRAIEKELANVRKLRKEINAKKHIESKQISQRMFEQGRKRELQLVRKMRENSLRELEMEEKAQRRGFKSSEAENEVAKIIDARKKAVESNVIGPRTGYEGSFSKDLPRTPVLNTEMKRRGVYRSLSSYSDSSDEIFIVADSNSDTSSTRRSEIDSELEMVRELRRSMSFDSESNDYDDSSTDERNSVKCKRLEGELEMISQSMRSASFDYSYRYESSLQQRKHEIEMELNIIREKQDGVACDDIDTKYKTPVDKWGQSLPVERKEDDDIVNAMKEKPSDIEREITMVRQVRESAGYTHTKSKYCKGNEVNKEIGEIRRIRAEGDFVDVLEERRARCNSASERQAELERVRATRQRLVYSSGRSEARRPMSLTDGELGDVRKLRRTKSLGSLAELTGIGLDSTSSRRSWVFGGVNVLPYREVAIDVDAKPLKDSKSKEKKQGYVFL